MGLFVPPWLFRVVSDFQPLRFPSLLQRSFLALHGIFLYIATLIVVDIGKLKCMYVEKESFLYFLVSIDSMYSCCLEQFSVFFA